MQFVILQTRLIDPVTDDGGSFSGSNDSKWEMFPDITHVTVEYKI